MGRVLKQRSWETYESMDKALNMLNGSDHIKELLMTGLVSSNNSLVEPIFPQAASTTISYIGKTELTIVLAVDTNDNAYDGHSVTGYYLNALGIEQTFTALYNTAASTTEVACCTDFYCWNPKYGLNCLVSTVAVQAGDNVVIGQTGCVADATLRVATILAAATTPIAANLLGVGTMWGRMATNHDDSDGFVYTVDYITPWFELIEGATWTINTTNGTTEVRIQHPTYSTVYADNIWRILDLRGDAPTVNTGIFVLTDADCSNVDGSGSDVWGAVQLTVTQMFHTRLYSWPSEDTAGRYGLYLGDITVDLPTVADVIVGQVIFTPKDGSEQTLYFGGLAKAVVPINEQLEPDTYVKILIGDGAGSGINEFVTGTVYCRELRRDRSRWYRPMATRPSRH